MKRPAHPHPVPERTPYRGVNIGEADTEADIKALFAWEAHRALLYLEAREPALAENPVWRLVRMDVVEEFRRAMIRSDDL